MSETVTANTLPLYERTCEKCKTKGGAPEKLSEADLALYKEQICKSWEIIKKGESDAIRRAFVAKNFQAALDYVVAVGALAEEQGHHPDLHITSYRTVEIVIYTHSLDTLAVNDFILASKCDRIPITYSPKFLKENPNVTAGVDK
jgi:4a-hydroxytetrahydrobiopterin dehydratase